MSNRINKKNEDELLYHELPSIAPRVSTTERLSMRRGCRECQPPYMVRAKKSAQHLYYFYIAFLAICFIAIQLYLKNTKNKDIVQENTKNISVSVLRTGNVTLIDQMPNRYGVSILLRNNGFRSWKVGQLLLSNKNNHIFTNININHTINKKDYYSTFISLSEEYRNIDDIIISIIP